MSSHNPFRTPKAELTQPPATPEQPMPLLFGRLLGDSLNLALSYPGQVFGGFVLTVLLMGLSTLTVLGAFLLAPVLYWGYIRMLLSLAEGRAGGAELFSGFKNYQSRNFSLLLALILVNALPYLIGAAYGLAMPHILSFQHFFPFFSLLSLVQLLLIPVYARWLLTLAICVDQELSGWRSFQASWQQSKKHWLLFIGILVVVEVIPNYLWNQLFMLTPWAYGDGNEWIVQPYTLVRYFIEGAQRLALLVISIVAYQTITPRKKAVSA